MSSECERLHELVWPLKKYRFSDCEQYKPETPGNAIQILSQDGEVGHQADRIVMIGTRKNIKDYIPSQSYERDNLFPIHIKRALKAADNPKYPREKAMEYVLDNFYFQVLEVDDDVYRKKIKKRMIATVAQCRKCHPSRKWPGHHYASKKITGEDLKKTAEKIRKGGLWQVQYIHGKQLLDAKDFKYISDHIRVGCVEHKNPLRRLLAWLIKMIKLIRGT